MTGYLMRLGRSIMVAGLTGLATGVVAGGIGARLAMRVVALFGDPIDLGRRTEAGARIGDITLGGTIFLFVAATLFTTIATAIIYVAFARLLRGGTLLRGLELGGILLIGLGAQLITHLNVDFAKFATPALTIGSFAVLFVMAGLVAVPVGDWFERRLPAAGSPQGFGLLYAAALGVGGLLMVSVLGAAILPGSDAAGSLIVVLPIAYTLVAHARTDRWVTWLGWALVAAIVAWGGVALAREVVQIVDATKVLNI